MNLKHYQNIINKSPFGYAYHKIILGDNGFPIDYEFLEVNPTFEKLTGLKTDNIINHRVTEVIPGIEKGEFDWIGFYGEIAINGGEREFEQYLEPNNQWYKILVYSPEKYYFITIFTDISIEIKALNNSIKFLHQDSNAIGYQEITDDLLKISHAKYISFNLFEDNGLEFTTVAVSGVNEHIKKAVEYLGFNLVGKRWALDLVREEKIMGKKITRFNTLSDLAGAVLPATLIKFLEKTFNLGQIAIVVIKKGNLYLGDFTLIMPAGVNLKNDLLIENYAQQVGLFLDRKRIENALQSSEEKFRNMVWDLQVGVILQGPKSEIILSNPKALEFLGLSEDQLLGKTSFDPDWNVIHEDGTPFPGQEHPVPQAIASKKSVRNVIMGVYRPEIGDRVWLLVDAEPQLNSDGSVRQVVCSFNNISIRKKAEAEIILKNEELQKINIEKDKFFSIIAHDLRSPFNSFLGLTQIMAESLPKLTMDEIQTIAVSMRNSATNLYRLLENLLQWARMQQDMIPFNPKEIRLIEIAEDSLAMILEPSKAKGVEISIDIPEGLIVYADSNMLQTVLRNLVSNAVKFTLNGGKVCLTANNSTDSIVEFSIQDSGIGMRKSMVEHLFELDAQPYRKGTEGEPSTGLGLLLCKEFVEKHGGKIWVESEEGKGSKFYFSILQNRELEG